MTFLGRKEWRDVTVETLVSSLVNTRKISSLYQNWLILKVITYLLFTSFRVFCFLRVSEFRCINSMSNVHKILPLLLGYFLKFYRTNPYSPIVLSIMTYKLPHKFNHPLTQEWKVHTLRSKFCFFIFPWHMF